MASPARRMKAGTRNALTMVASISTASPSPMPNILRKLTPEVPKAKVIESNSAAAVMMLPVRSRPSATDASLSPTPSAV